MRKKRKLLIINPTQFGYHLDTFYYCKYLREVLNITYIGFDFNKKHIILDGLKVIYIPRDGYKIFKYLIFLYKTIKELKRNAYDLHFIRYFIGCSFLKLIYLKKKFIFDVRTGGVQRTKISRKLYNLLIRVESNIFNHITIISEGLRKQLKLNKEKSFILPLGAEIISNNKKTWNKLNLIYIGTLWNRDIENTILGFYKFYKEYHDKIQMNYIIIGEGIGEEIELQNLVNELSLSNVIKFLGYIHHDKIKMYMDISNLGVSYVPMKNYFEFQPPTKTFEYLLNGLPVIATATKENKKIIKDSNGILIKDNPDDFYNGLKKFIEIREFFSSDLIVKSAINFEWKYIVENIFLPYLTKCIIGD